MKKEIPVTWENALFIQVQFGVNILATLIVEKFNLFFFINFFCFVRFLVFVCFFKTRVSQCSPGYPRTFSVDQAGPKLNRNPPASVS